ncbi:RNA-binding protein 28-like [Pectinophora gossypiella]|uniref:RNA-binding protein 28-like n=1 Tax=Pectinophora gossypiella TaxID=13191 RepID=UPI00214EECFF|nr:RNA-binding protein 28-like [Pectinophora gossypiella]
MVREKDEAKDNTKFKEGVNKNARLVVRNVPFKATESDLKTYFSQYGTVEEIKLLKKPDGRLVGCGFVHFTHVPMANKALAATNKKPFLGRPLQVGWAVPQHKYSEGTQNDGINERKRVTSISSDDSKPVTVKEGETENSHSGKKDKNKPKVNRKARLIIRNMSFKATEETLKEHFQPYGEVLEVNLLKKPDGKLVGGAFVQFKNVPMAKNALMNTNMKPFIGRPISVDWAVPKDKYMQHTINQQLELQENIKKEESDSDDDDGPAFNTSNEELKAEVKSESEDSDSEADVKSEKDSDSDSDDEKDSDDDDDNDDEEDEQDVDEEESDRQSETSTQPERQRIKLNDAEDGCTVFITNIPFIVDNDQLKLFAEKTGPVKYALVCMDKMTEHSKGSGFVKFVSKEDADKFLQLPADQLRLEGQIMLVKPALKRENLQQDKKKEAKDNRNLYLVKEGVIVAGTKAAVGVSASDMSKRLALERSKTQMLKNLNRFVSRYRIVVSNLPAHYDDAKLRKLCVDTVGRKAVITEARVMRDLRAPTGKDGRHTSKGYGFVMFMRHEDALACLRKLNNNPDIFDKNNRPIVSFSIEDRTALNARKKRLEKSIANNPLANKTENSETNNKKNRKRKMNMPPDESYVKKGRFENNKANAGKFVRPNVDEEAGEYTGLTAKQGSQHKMRSNHKLRTQAAVHRQNVKLEKKKSQRSMRFKMAAKERIKLPKQKINKTKTKSNNKRRFKDKSVF